MRKIIISVISCLAIVVFGIHTSNAAEPIINCGSDPMNIEIGDIIDCGIVKIGGSRNFKFYGDVGDKIRITMLDRTTDSPMPYLKLYDPDNVRISYWNVQDSGRHVDYDLKKTGMYTIVISEYNDNQLVKFRIVLQGMIPSPREARILNPDSQLDGDIDPVTDSDVFFFDGTIGDKIRITMLDRTSGSAMPYLKLYDPDGVRISYWNVQDSGRHVDYDLKKTGRYTIVICEYNDNQLVNFRIALQGMIPSPREARILNPDSQLDGDIDPVTDSDVFFFDGTIGDKIRITMLDRTSGSAMPYLKLYDPDGVRISYWNVQDSGRHVDYDLKKTGRYTIVICEYNDNQLVNFRIALQGMIPLHSKTRRICHDKQYTDDIDPVTDSDVFFFDGTIGDKIRITMLDRTSGSAMPYLKLYDPDGVRISYWNVQDSGRHVDYDLKKTGIYTIVICEYNDNQMVTYILSFNCISGKCFDCPEIFVDVAPGSNHEASIYAIYDAGITTGCFKNPLMYCPEDDVTRAQMAAFIIRALEGEPTTDCDPNNPPFPDVDPNLPVCKYIKRLSELEITTGYPDGTYRPYNNVTRAQMAAFIIRALEGEPRSDYCDSGSPFPDVPASSPTCKYIKRFFELEITTGYPDGTYRPGNNVTRRQMAGFLDRAFLQMD